MCNALFLIYSIFLHFLLHCVQNFNSGRLNPSSLVLCVICLHPFSDISINPQLADPMQVSHADSNSTHTCHNKSCFILPATTTTTTKMRLQALNYLDEFMKAEEQPVLPQ